MSMLLLMMLAACGGGDQPITAAAVSYYIDATAGGDDQSGRSPATAWQSFSNLPTITTAATLYLKRGESWQQPLVIPRSNITVDLYGSGTAPALLDGSALVPAWQVEGVNQYRYTPSLLSGEYLGNLSRDGLMVNFLPWKTDLSTTFSGASFDSFSLITIVQLSISIVITHQLLVHSAIANWRQALLPVALVIYPSQG